MKQNILLLVNQRGNQYFPEYLEECEIVSPFKNDNMINRIFRKVLLKLKIYSLEKVLFNHYHKIAQRVNMIILFDTGNANGILAYLRKRYPEKRLILWYWNPVSRSIHPDSIKVKGVELWSFDQNDCNKYNLKYNTQFYIPSNIQRMETVSIENNDVLFVGVDKKRIVSLNDLAVELKKQNIKYLYYLVKSNRADDCSKELEYNPPMTYPRLMAYIKHTKSIIDIEARDQCGLSLRPLEALFFEKKLITDNKNIINTDLYNKNNVFIIGLDSNKILKNFIYSKFDYTNYEILTEKYSICGWLSRF